MTERNKVFLTDTHGAKQLTLDLPIGLLIFAVLLSAVYAMCFLTQQPSFYKTVFKTLPVAILGLWAASQSAPLVLVYGFALSALGDAALSREGNRPFLWGLSFFLLAHLCYLYLFATHSAFPNIYGHLNLGMIAALAIGCAITLYFIGPNLGALRIPVIAYMLIISAMAYAGWTSGRGLILALGIALFLASDTLLAFQIFYIRNHGWSRTVSYGVWLTYFSGQCLIGWAMMPEPTG